MAVCHIRIAFLNDCRNCQKAGSCAGNLHSSASRGKVGAAWPTARWPLVRSRSRSAYDTGRATYSVRHTSVIANTTHDGRRKSQTAQRREASATRRDFACIFAVRCAVASSTREPTFLRPFGPPPSLESVSGAQRVGLSLSRRSEIRDEILGCDLWMRSLDMIVDATVDVILRVLLHVARRAATTNASKQILTLGENVHSCALRAAWICRAACGSVSCGRDTGACDEAR